MTCSEVWSTFQCYILLWQEVRIQQDLCIGDEKDTIRSTEVWRRYTICGGITIDLSEIIYSKTIIQGGVGAKI